MWHQYVFRWLLLHLVSIWNSLDIRNYHNNNNEWVFIEEMWKNKSNLWNQHKNNNMNNLNSNSTERINELTHALWKYRLIDEFPTRSPQYLNWNDAGFPHAHS